MGASGTVPLFEEGTEQYHKIIMKIQNICAIILIEYQRMGELMLWKLYGRLDRKRSSS